jgi:hypothetical protein
LRKYGTACAVNERFDDPERTIDGLDAAIPRPDIVLRPRLGYLAPDHISLHHDLASSGG